MELLLHLSPIVLSIVVLSYASWSDIKTREVSNFVWVIYAPLGFLLTLTELLFFTPSSSVFYFFLENTVISAIINYIASITISSVFAIGLFYVGAFGGADAKALMCIALATPLPPSIIQPLSGFVSPVFPITVFSNAVILAAMSVVYALLRNLIWKLRTRRALFEGYETESLGQKIIALLCGYKVSVDDLQKSFLYPLELVETQPESGALQKNLTIFPKDEDREELVNRIVKANAAGKMEKWIWATPGLPMLVFITIGFLLALTVGDIIWLVILHLL